MSTRVLIVEDDPAFMRRLSDAVLADPELSLVAAVSTGRAAIAMLDGQAPQVMLVDLGLPDISGIDVIRHAARHQPLCEVLVVSMFGDDEHVIASIEAGAAGYLLKDAAPGSIAGAIHDVRAGGSPVSPGIARRVLERFRVAATPSLPSCTTGATDPPSLLTGRETEILRLMAKGLSFDAIGDLLDISPHTVVAHLRKIYRKLAVHSRSEAVYEAGRIGLL